jgi:YhcN/YlaJ family sporulation lipoprotein
MMFKRLLSASVAITFLVGCGNQNADMQQQNNAVHEVKQSVNEPAKKLNGREISKRLVGIATDIPGVNHATAVVAGDYAVVGIDVDKNLDQTRVGSIKNAVANALKNDPYGANAVVTSDPDIYQRLRNIAKHIRNGKPASGIAEELSAIVERIVPEVPNRPLTPSQNIENKQPRPSIDENPKRAR